MNWEIILILLIAFSSLGSNQVLIPINQVDLNLSNVLTSIDLTYDGGVIVCALNSTFIAFYYVSNQGYYKLLLDYRFNTPPNYTATLVSSYNDTLIIEFVYTLLNSSSENFTNEEVLENSYSNVTIFNGFNASSTKVYRGIVWVKDTPKGLIYFRYLENNETELIIGFKTYLIRGYVYDVIPTHYGYLVISSPQIFLEYPFNASVGLLGSWNLSFPHLLWYEVLDKDLLAVSTDSSLYILRLNNGSIISSIQIPGDNLVISSPITVKGSTFFIVGGNLISFNAQGVNVISLPNITYSIYAKNIGDYFFIIGVNATSTDLENSDVEFYQLLITNYDGKILYSHIYPPNISVSGAVSDGYIYLLLGNNITIYKPTFKIIISNTTITGIKGKGFYGYYYVPVIGASVAFLIYLALKKRRIF